jgi:uncharacterized cupredoxin-like copper-binding protein
MKRTTLVVLSVLTTLLGVSLVAWASMPRTQVLRVALTDFEITGLPTMLKAGTVTLISTNEGHGAVHEIRLVKTTLPADHLPLERDGRVDEANAEFTTIAAVEDLYPGMRAEVTVMLEPGRYVYFCNEHNHYVVGMRGEMTVEP